MNAIACQATIEINNLLYLPDFVRLNEDWISEYFVLEEADRKLAERPEAIIEEGGYIFTVMESGNVIGTCALFKECNDVFQLARMAVSKSHRGLGYSRLLMDAAMQKLSDQKARRVYLLSNTRLIPALSLYKKYGFVTLSQGQHPIYARCDIVLEKFLNH